MRNKIIGLVRSKILDLTLALLAPVAAKAVVNGVVSYVYSQEVNSFVKTEAFYRAPENINGFSFMNFNKGGYFGKTDLKMPLTHGIGPEVELVHGNEPFSEIKVGINVQIPKLPKNLYGSIRVLPVHVDRKGDIHRGNVGYFVGANLPYGIQLNAFGDWNLNRGGINWDYGEAFVGRKFGPVNVGYNPLFSGNRNGIPRNIEHRVSAGVGF